MMLSVRVDRGVLWWSFGTAHSACAAHVHCAGVPKADRFPTDTPIRDVCALHHNASQPALNDHLIRPGNCTVGRVTHLPSSTENSPTPSTPSKRGARPPPNPAPRPHQSAPKKGLVRALLISVPAAFSADTSAASRGMYSASPWPCRRRWSDRRDGVVGGSTLLSPLL